MSWLRRVLNTIRPARIERDIDRELAFHLAERVDQLQADGLSREAAARRASSSATCPAAVGAHARHGHLASGLTRGCAISATRCARWRGRRASPSPPSSLWRSASAPTATVFSALDAVLLQAAGLPRQRSVDAAAAGPETTPEANIAPVRLEDWQRLNTTFDNLTGYYMEDVSETSGDIPERVRRAWVAPRFLDVWRPRPPSGRGFTAEEHRSGGPGAVLMSHRYWQQRFGAESQLC